MGMYIPNMKSEQFYDLCKELRLGIIAIPVPDHGRLIDADAAIRYLSVILDPVVAPKACGVIAGMPAIIPAEEGET